MSARESAAAGSGMRGMAGGSGGTTNNNTISLSNIGNAKASVSGSGNSGGSNKGGGESKPGMSGEKPGMGGKKPPAMGGDKPVMGGMMMNPDAAAKRKERMMNARQRMRLNMAIRKAKKEGNTMRAMRLREKKRGLKMDNKITRMKCAKGKGKCGTMGGKKTTPKQRMMLRKRVMAAVVRGSRMMFNARKARMAQNAAKRRAMRNNRMARAMRVMNRRQMAMRGKRR